jgi:hypothetical protein
MKTYLAVLVAVLATAPAAWGQAARVDGVLAPAWLERGGRAVPLSPGVPLQADDKIVTGGNGRARLTLAEGSAIRLGQNATFTIDRVESRGIFRAAFNVLEGAFRFTTAIANKARPRDVSIRVKNVTAGIRGTDLWGKSTDEKDLVCLLEGAITVGSEGHPTVTLDNPNDFYVRPRDGSPVVSKVDAAQVAAWSAETAMDGEEAAAEGKGWRIVVSTLPIRDDALRLVRRLRGLGFAAELGSRGESYLVQIGGYPTERHARAVMANLRGLPGIGLPKVEPVR